MAPLSTSASLKWNSKPFFSVFKSEFPSGMGSPVKRTRLPYFLSPSGTLQKPRLARPWFGMGHWTFQYDAPSCYEQPEQRSKAETQSYPTLEQGSRSSCGLAASIPQGNAVPVKHKATKSHQMRLGQKKIMALPQKSRIICQSGSVSEKHKSALIKSCGPMPPDKKKKKGMHTWHLLFKPLSWNVTVLDWILLTELTPPPNNESVCLILLNKLLPMQKWTLEHN